MAMGILQGLGNGLLAAEIRGLAVAAANVSEALTRASCCIVEMVNSFIMFEHESEKQLVIMYRIRITVIFGKRSKLISSSEHWTVYFHEWLAI